jgi:hypothetical protein
VRSVLSGCLNWHTSIHGCEYCGAGFGNRVTAVPYGTQFILVTGESVEDSSGQMTMWAVKVVLDDMASIGGAGKQLEMGERWRRCKDEHIKNHTVYILERAVGTDR